MTKTKALGTLARELAEEQLKNDLERTSAFPPLLRRKLDRMGASPLAFLRGAAPLFYELLKENPDLGEGPAGTGWIVGDLHIENFGAYRPDEPEGDEKAKRPAVFDLNDFDDTVVGPWRFDVLRFATSLLLAGRELGIAGGVALALLDHVLEAWSHAAFDGQVPSAMPDAVKGLVETVRSRSKAQLLDARTKDVAGKRTFIRGQRYMDLEPDVLEQVPRTFEAYIATVSKEEMPSKGSLAIDDAAFRIAGTGSLGGLRIAVIVEGKKGSHGGHIFDLKEQGTPSAATILGEPKMDPAVRVVTGFRACIEHPASALGVSQIKVGKKDVPLFGRRLSPQEDKLNLPKLKATELPELATYLGALLGRAHARGAEKVKGSDRWNKSDRDTIRAQAIALAGIHEAVYLALCERTRTI